ncbi:hypothetical protein [Sphingomonas jaspsi]|uniref:hypothetical protein n=1 Tax=Sphingomonas jaspsi TaxID=392409 RepID=UPI0004B312D6|nr:hypothetical protein [Sphingomonas jaspsi]
MKIVLHGELAKRFGREHTIQTNVPAEALEGLSRQFADWPREMAVDVVGYRTEEKLRTPTTDKELHLMPAMHGGGGVVKIVIGVVMIVAAIILPKGPWTPILMSMGASLIMSGVCDLLMKAPTVDKSNDPPASKYLGINRNTVAIGTFIPLAYGRNKIAGHWLSLQSDSNQLVATSFPATTS